jgi:hypothetical protein
MLVFLFSGPARKIAVMLGSGRGLAPEEALTDMTADGGLAAWAEASGRRRGIGCARGELRFSFLRRVSTEDWQDPVTSRSRQRAQAEELVRGHGHIVAEFFDEGQSRTVAWGRRPQSAALVAQLADLCRGGDAIVVGDDQGLPIGHDREIALTRIFAIGGAW